MSVTPSTALVQLFAIALLVGLTLPGLSQSTIGLRFSGEFANRTIRTDLEGTDPREDALSDQTFFVFRQGIALAYERQLNSIFAATVQFRYQNLGYEFRAEAPILDPQTGAPSTFDFTTQNLRYDFIALPVGASETWGNGAIRFYVEEYLVPMFYLTTSNTTTFDDAPETTSSDKLDRVNDFHLGVQAGIGIERLIGSTLRVRLGLVGRYNFTLTNDETEFREHLYSFGPQLSLGRVFGRAATPTGKADEIYY